MQNKARVAEYQAHERKATLSARSPDRPTRSHPGQRPELVQPPETGRVKYLHDLGPYRIEDVNLVAAVGEGAVGEDDVDQLVGRIAPNGRAGKAQVALGLRRSRFGRRLREARAGFGLVPAEAAAARVVGPLREADDRFELEELPPAVVGFFCTLVFLYYRAAIGL